MKLTHYQIAATVGIHRTYVTKIVNGKKQLKSWPVAKGLAEVTGTTPELWLEGTPEQKRAAIKAAEARQ